MDAVTAWLQLVLAVVLVLGWYLSYSAGRLDRLHHRVESARAALDAQLVRRAAGAAQLAPLLEDFAGSRLAEAAVAARALEDSAPHDGVLPRPQVREGVENDLTKALHLALDDDAPVARIRAGSGAPLVDALAGTCARVQLARRFHNDTVAHTQRVRRKRVVRWARLAGRAELPQMVEIDDSLPAGLTGHALPTG